MITGNENETPTQPADLPLVLEYSRRRRAKQVAVGGLSMLSMAFVGFGLLWCSTLGGIPIDAFLTPANWGLLGLALLPFAVGITQFVCAYYVHHGNRAAALVACVIVTFEAIGGLVAIVFLWRELINDSYDGIPIRLLVGSLPVFVFVALVAVDYEILQVFRDEAKVRRKVAD